MTIQLSLATEVEQSLRDQAGARGLPVPTTRQAGESITLYKPNIIQPRPPQPAHSPRGLLPTPPLVEQTVAREVAKFPTLNAEAKKRITDYFNLQYYFEGQDIAYRFTEQGVEVLAVGLEEMAKSLENLSQEELLSIILGQG